MESALVEQARAGDADAFDELARRRIDSVYRTALGILGSPSDARDATQDALLSAWRSLPTLRDAERFDAWLHRITLNSARMVARRRRSTSRGWATVPAWRFLFAERDAPMIPISHVAVKDRLTVRPIDDSGPGFRFDYAIGEPGSSSLIVSFIGGGAIATSSRPRQSSPTWVWS